MRPQSTQGSKNYKTELYTLAASVMYLLTIFYFKCFLHSSGSFVKHKAANLQSNCVN